MADVFPIASSRREAQGPSIPQRLGWIVKFSLTVGVDIVNDIKRLFLEFQSAVVSFHQTLKRELGGKNFIVKDWDGKFLLFAGPADKSALAQSRIGRRPPEPYLDGAENDGVGTSDHVPRAALPRCPL